MQSIWEILHISLSRSLSVFVYCTRIYILYSYLHPYPSFDFCIVLIPYICIHICIYIYIFCSLYLNFVLNLINKNQEGEGLKDPRLMFYFQFFLGERSKHILLLRQVVCFVLFVCYSEISRLMCIRRDSDLLKGCGFPCVPKLWEHKGSS